jgi:hypothetical protein
MPNKAIETFRAVMSGNPIKELLRLESIRKSRSKGNILKRAKRASRKYPVPKKFSLEKVHTTKI